MMEEHHTLSLPHIFKNFRYTTETQVYGSWKVKTIPLFVFIFRPNTMDYDICSPVFSCSAARKKGITWNVVRGVNIVNAKIIDYLDLEFSFAGDLVSDVRKKHICYASARIRFAETNNGQFVNWTQNIRSICNMYTVHGIPNSLTCVYWKTRRKALRFRKSQS